MAYKLTRDFFKAENLAFFGYSRKSESHCARIKSEFEQNGSKVYPINPAGEVNGVKTFASIRDVPAACDMVFFLTNKIHTKELVETLVGKGVKKALFASSLNVDQATIARCKELGMTTAIACPLMTFGKGLHRFHGFLSGVEAR